MSNHLVSNVVVTVIEAIGRSHDFAPSVHGDMAGDFGCLLALGQLLGISAVVFHGVFCGWLIVSEIPVAGARMPL